MQRTLDTDTEKQKQIKLRPAEGHPVLGPANAEMSALCRSSVWGNLPLTGAALQILLCLDFPKLLRHLKTFQSQNLLLKLDSIGSVKSKPRPKRDNAHW